MSGFFDESELDDVIRGDEALVKKGRKPKAATCAECGLSHGCKSPKMPPTGEGKKGILLIAEAPGKTEDEKGIQLIGKAGKFVRGVLEDMGLDIDRDFWKTNAVCCRPPNNNTPTPLQVAACRWRVMEAIKEYQPKVIIPMGKIAVDSLLGHRITGRLNGLSMTDWQGHEIPDQELQAFVCPTWHPSFILRSGQNDKVDGVLKSQFISHMKRAVELSDKPFYSYNFESECITTMDVNEAIEDIHHVMKSDLVTVDYETTGLKPYREGHRIVVASVCDGMYSFAFPFFKDFAFREAWNKLMTSEKVRKVAHNAKFEALWTAVRAGEEDGEGYWPRRMDGCSMLAAHATDNREKVNLKFQTYARFGIMGYDDEIDPYLKATKHEKTLYGDNAFNSIDQAPMDKLLLYCAMDSLATYKLWEQLTIRIPSQHMLQGINFFSEASVSLAKAEWVGIAYDEEIAREQEKHIQAKMDRLESQVMNMPVLKKWDKPKPFRMSAPADIGYVLFDLMEKACDDEDRTGTGRPKCDEATLAKYDLPIVKKVLAWRKWSKVESTYLKGFTREAWDGFLHPSFNLYGVDTFRSSSDGPNFQNIPKRNEQVAAILRELIRPRPGRRLAAYDYGQMEFIIYTCYTKDKTMIKYVNDPDSDVHRDQAAEIFLKEKSDIDKVERFNGKNGFTFPTIYGSWYKNTARNIWTASQPHTIQHLRSQGIKNLNDFTAHMEDVEQNFWERFHTAYEWMEKAISDYNKKGYIELLTGFRCYGPMSRNQLINYRVQGSAFHCLLWTFHQMMGWLERKKKQSLLEAQIHDEMFYDMVPEEEAELDHAIWLYGTQKIREYWDWIIVPLTIEKSLSAVDGSWSEMIDCGVLNG